MKLSEVKVGDEVYVLTVDTEQREVIYHLSALGLTKGAKITVIRHQAEGPIIIHVRGSRLILGRDLSNKILVGKYEEEVSH